MNGLLDDYERGDSRILPFVRDLRDMYVANNPLGKPAIVGEQVFYNSLPSHDGVKEMLASFKSLKGAIPQHIFIICAHVACLSDSAPGTLGCIALGKSKDAIKDMLKGLKGVKRMRIFLPGTFTSI